MDFIVKVGDYTFVMSDVCWEEVLGCFDAFQGHPDLFSEPARRFYGYED